MHRLPIAISGTVLVCGAVGILGYFHVQHQDSLANAAFLTSHPLIQDLPHDRALAGAEIEARLRRNFPMGTPIAGLRTYLASQGFEIHDAEGKPRNYVASLSRLGNLAYLPRRDWYVSWQEDQTGHLLTLTATQFVQMS